MIYLDYDSYYDTKISRSYGNSKLGYVSGILIAALGLMSIILNISELYTTVYNQNGGQTDSTKVYTWDENPIWQSYGKGFWIGLVTLVTGLIGFVSGSEQTITSIYAFIFSCVTSAILSFYLVISCSIPLSKYVEEDLKNNAGDYYVNSLTINSISIVISSLTFLVASAIGIASSYLSGLFDERRGYGGAFIEQFYKSKLSI